MLDLQDLINKTQLTGLGILSLTREKAQAIVDDLVNRGEVKREQTQELVEKLVTWAKEERTALQRLVHEEVQKVIDKAPLAKKEDIDALSEKVKDLADKVNPL
jgi:polyhydroxyalkanoate synthesis regulator phasin